MNVWISFTLSKMFYFVGNTAILFLVPQCVYFTIQDGTFCLFLCQWQTILLTGHAAFHLCHVMFMLKVRSGLEWRVFLKCLRIWLSIIRKLHSWNGVESRCWVSECCYYSGFHSSWTVISIMRRIPTKTPCDAFSQKDTELSLVWKCPVAHEKILEGLMCASQKRNL